MSWTCDHCGKENTPKYSAPINHFMCYQFPDHNTAPCGASSSQKKKVGWTTALFLVTCRRCLKHIAEYRKQHGTDPESKDCTRD